MEVGGRGGVVMYDIPEKRWGRKRWRGSGLLCLLWFLWRSGYGLLVLKYAKFRISWLFESEDYEMKVMLPIMLVLLYGVEYQGNLLHTLCTC